MRRLPDDRPPAGPIRALYADLDGTILGPGGSLFATPQGPSPRASLALHRLQLAGVELVLVSGRTRRQMQEAARILSASAYVAELGAFLVEGGATEEVLTNFGAFHGPGTPYAAMARSGAGAHLLESYRGCLEPHSPWAFDERDATMLFRGLLDPAEAEARLADAGYGWLSLLDNGVIPRTYPTLDLPEVRAYHLLPRGVDKAVAVRLHRERHGLAPEECAAVGDSPTDLALADEVRAMFIVANGLPSLGDAAERLENLFATPSPDGDGFAEAVEALLP